MTRPTGKPRSKPARPRVARRAAAAAFTLVESLMAILIVSGVLVASVGTFGAIGRARQMQVDRAQAFGLAQRVMTEVLQCRFEDPSGGTTSLGPEAGETGRAQFDDVDDYHDWGSTPRARDGSALEGFPAGWSVNVWVRSVDPADVHGAAASSVPGLKRIQMRVTSPAGVRLELYAMRSRDGAYEQTPSETTNYLTWGGVAVRVGEKGRTVYGGAHPLNVTTSQ